MCNFCDDLWLVLFSRREASKSLPVTKLFVLCNHFISLDCKNSVGFTWPMLQLEF